MYILRPPISIGRTVDVLAAGMLIGNLWVSLMPSFALYAPLRVPSVTPHVISVLIGIYMSLRVSEVSNLLLSVAATSLLTGGVISVVIALPTFHIHSPAETDILLLRALQQGLFAAAVTWVEISLGGMVGLGMRILLRGG